MTEQEVIQYLKDNMKKGISFHFTPKEVQDWIMKNYRDCAYLNDDGVWDKAGHHVTGADDIWASDVYALIEGYEPKEQKGGWIEFDITDNAFICSDEKEHDRWHFFWWDWQAFLTESNNSVLGYIAFGGWQYEEDGDWHTSPQLSLIDDTKREYHLGRYTDGKAAERVKPLIPIKIRFWREK